MAPASGQASGDAVVGAVLDAVVDAWAHPHLLARLVEVVRPQFRAEVFHPPRDSEVFCAGTCAVCDCPTMISHTARGICAGHYKRWAAERRRAPETVFEEWLVAEGARTRRRHAPPTPCLIEGCNRAKKEHGLCHRHADAWARVGRPDLQAWAGQTLYRRPWTSSGGERDCCFPLGCPRWTDGPGRALCIVHYEQWRKRGRPDLQAWAGELAHGNDPRVDLTRLGRQLRLEVQFGLQRRHDQATKRSMVRTIRTAVTMICRAAATRGLASLLDWQEQQWRDFVGGTRANRTSFQSSALQFILDTRLGLHILLTQDDPWADQYPRDSWDLRVLGIAHDDIRYLRFAEIPQRWLRELVKRWTRWRLSRDLDPTTVAINVNGLRRFGKFLGPDAVVADLDREHIEAWLAKLRSDGPDTATRRMAIASLATFLRDVHHHGWQPDLSPTAFCYEDSPPPKPSKPRWIPEQVMAQLEAPDNLALFPSDDGRVLLQILINCGLRLKDARKLPYDCLVHDDAAAPYLAWINHKMNGRPAFFPISHTLQTAITDQRGRVRDRFPNGSPWLFPGRQANLNGARPVSDAWWRGQLETWLQIIQLHDHDGQPARVTPHQFRHTVGTRLINANVPQHVVQHLLDHMSPQMTAIYARLLDKTVREHWERATKLNADAQIVQLPPDHPLADAQWTRLAMVRAKVTLPNGYCGAPIQTDCEYANPCLDCRFFLTTTDFLPQHQQQLQETTRLIDDAKACGQARIVEKNTKTFITLDKLVATLTRLQPDQIVAGGQVEDLHATG